MEGYVYSTIQKALYATQIPVSTMVHVLQLIRMMDLLVIVKEQDMVGQHAA